MTQRTAIFCCFTLLLASCGAWAVKPAQPDGIGVRTSEARGSIDDETQRRRSDLRTSLQSQQQSGGVTPARQLSVEDRAELREQVRRQKRDNEH